MSSRAAIRRSSYAPNVPGNVRTVKWHTRTGKPRFIRLFRSWNNLRARLNGKTAGNGAAVWVGLTCEFKSWREFRAWALENGYSRARNSLDRIDPRKGYGPDNCQFLSVAENTAKMHADRARMVRAAFLDDSFGVVTSGALAFDAVDGVPF